MSLPMEVARTARPRCSAAGTARRELHAADLRMSAPRFECVTFNQHIAATKPIFQRQQLVQTHQQEPACCRRSSDPQQLQDGLRGPTAVVTAAIALQTLMTTCSMALPLPVQAHVAIDRLLEQQQQQQQLQQSALGPQQSLSAGFDPAAATRRGVLYPEQANNANSSSSRRNSSPVKSAASEALQQLAAAEAATTTGDYQAAYQAYNTVVQRYPDLALTEYARLGRAILLYQLGDSDKSIIALEDQELSMRGYPEVHAALAAVLYAERPAQRLRAEQQWDIALEFDSRYEDVEWVAKNKHWPPAMLQALQRFLLLE